jgi:hypothetical protein
VKFSAGLITGIFAGVVIALILGALAGANPPCAPTGTDHMSAFDRMWNDLLWGAMVNFLAIAPFTVIIGGGLGAFIGYRHQKYGEPPFRF